MLLGVQCGWTLFDGTRRLVCSVDGRGVTVCDVLVCCWGCSVDGCCLTVCDVWCVVGGCNVEGRGVTVCDVWCVVGGQCGWTLVTVSDTCCVVGGTVWMDVEWR